MVRLFPSVPRIQRVGVVRLEVLERLPFERRLCKNDTKRRQCTAVPQDNVTGGISGALTKSFTRVGQGVVEQ